MLFFLGEREGNELWLQHCKLKSARGEFHYHTNLEIEFGFTKKDLASAFIGSSVHQR